jgi:V8-like Glu-specific endopeptidase
MHRSSLPTRLLALGVGLAAAATWSVAGAGTADAAKRPVSQDVSSATPKVSADAQAAGRAKFGKDVTPTQALDAYWTPERMRAAKPVEGDATYQAATTAYLSKVSADQKAGRKAPTNDGPARSTDGVASKALATAATAVTATVPVTAAYQPNAPYYTPVAYTQGKVFFTNGAYNYQCSGTIINSEGKDTVWTAGHCVHSGSGGSWHTNWTFVPAYDTSLPNPRPYGTWSAYQLWSRTAWTGSSDFSQDMGVAIMNTNWGWHIVDYFGGQGLTVNRGKSGVWENAFGYPAESPYDGGHLQECWGSTSPEWDAWLVWSQTDKISCDMTRGSSGGAWLADFNGSWGRLNGVNSRIDRIVGPTIMLSPYFDDDAWSLYNSTRYL